MKSYQKILFDINIENDNKQFIYRYLIFSIGTREGKKIHTHILYKTR